VINNNSGIILAVVVHLVVVVTWRSRRLGSRGTAIGSGGSVADSLLLFLMVVVVWREGEVVVLIQTSAVQS
jgi:hypothetical protein